MSDLKAPQNAAFASIFRDGDTAPESLDDFFRLAVERADGPQSEQIAQNPELLRIQALAVDAALASLADPLAGLPKDPALWGEKDLDSALKAHGFGDVSSIKNYQLGSVLSLALRVAATTTVPDSFVNEWEGRAKARRSKKDQEAEAKAAKRKPRPDGIALSVDEQALADGLESTLARRLAPVPGALSTPWPPALLRRVEMSAAQLDALLFHANACDWLLTDPASLPAQAAKYGVDGLWGAVAQPLSRASGAPIESIKKLRRLMSDERKHAEGWRVKCYYLGVKWRANLSAGGDETRAAQEWIKSKGLASLIPATELSTGGATMKFDPVGITATQHKQFERAMEATNESALRINFETSVREQAWMCAQALAQVRDWTAELSLPAGSASILARVSSLGSLDRRSTQAGVRQAVGAVALSDSFLSPSQNAIATNSNAAQAILSSFIEPAARVLGFSDGAALVERTAADLRELSERVASAAGEWMALTGELDGAPALALPIEKIALRKEADGQWSAWALNQAAWSEKDNQWAFSGAPLAPGARTGRHDFNPFGSRRMDWPEKVAMAVHAARIEKSGGDRAGQELRRRVSTLSHVAAEWVADSEEGSVARWVAAAQICALNALSCDETDQTNGSLFQDLDHWLDKQQQRERAEAADSGSKSALAKGSPAQAALDMARAAVNPAQWNRKIGTWEMRAVGDVGVLATEGDAAGLAVCIDWEASLEAAVLAAEARAGVFFAQHGSINILEAHRKLAEHRIQPATLAGLMETARSGATAVQLIDERPAFHRLCLLMAQKLGVPTTLSAPGRVKAIAEERFDFGPGAWKMLSKVSEPAAVAFAHAIEAQSETLRAGDEAGQSSGMLQMGRVLSVLASANVDGPAFLSRLFGDAAPTVGDVYNTHSREIISRLAALNMLLVADVPARQVRGLAEAQQYVAECQARAARIPELARALSAIVMSEPTAQGAGARLNEVKDFFQNSEQGVWLELPEKIGEKSLMRRVQDWHRLLAHKKTQESLEKTVATIRAGLAQSIRQGDCASFEEGMRNAEKGAWPFSLNAREKKIGESVWSATALDTAGALFEEGRAMHHCVSSYASACAAGESRIYSIKKNGVRVSTMQLQAEFDRDTGEFKAWRDIQNRGPHNGAIVDPDAKAFCREVAKDATAASLANIERGLAEITAKDAGAKKLAGISQVAENLAAARLRRGEEGEPGLPARAPRQGR